MMPGTVTEERTDLEILEALDFEPDRACRIRTLDCTKTATLIIMCRACGASEPVCASCVRRCRAELESAQRSWGPVLQGTGQEFAAQCNICKTMRVEFDALWHVMPLPGGAS